MPKRTNPDRAEWLALALAGGESVGGWAKRNGVNPRAVYKLAARPSTKAMVAKYRAESVDRAIGILSKGATAAVAALLKIIGPDSKEPGAVRVAASKAILSALVEVSKYAELSERFAALEAKVNSQFSPAEEHTNG